jgi:hemolysin activation/secretion protein
LGAIHTNALGLDDTFVAGSSFGKDFAGMYFYHKLPVTGHGTHLLYGYNRSSSFPKKDYQYLDMNSKVESGSVFVYQDIFDRDRYRGYLSFGVEAKDKRVVTNAGAFHTDRDRIMRFGGAFVDQGQGNVTLLTPEYSQGINLFGASRKSPLSSRNAENTFSKFLFTGEFTQLLYGNFRAHLKTSCQLASEKLTPQEEFFLGGINSIRGYPWGDYLADGAFYTNFELLIPAFFLPNWLKVPYGERPLKEEITGLAFFDYGYGCKRGSREGEGTARRLAGAGPGVRIRLFNQALLRIEIGFPLDNMANLPETEFDRWRVHFTVEFEDRFPEEIERLQKALKAGQV